DDERTQPASSLCCRVGGEGRRQWDEVGRLVGLRQRETGVEERVSPVVVAGSHGRFVCDLAPWQFGRGCNGPSCGWRSVRVWRLRHGSGLLLHPWRLLGTDSRGGSRRSRHGDKGNEHQASKAQCDDKDAPHAPNATIRTWGREPSLASPSVAPVSAVAWPRTPVPAATWATSPVHRGD